MDVLISFSFGEHNCLPYRSATKLSQSRYTVGSRHSCQSDLLALKLTDCFNKKYWTTPQLASSDWLVL
jgi:hypothetical protein